MEAREIARRGFFPLTGGPVGCLRKLGLASLGICATYPRARPSECLGTYTLRASGERCKAAAMTEEDGDEGTVFIFCRQT